MTKDAKNVFDYSGKKKIWFLISLALIAVIIVVTVMPVRLFVIGSCLYLEQRTSTIIESAISTNLHISFDEFILYVRSKYRICCQIRCTYHSLYTAMRYFRL